MSLIRALAGGGVGQDAARTLQVQITDHATADVRERLLYQHQCLGESTCPVERWRFGGFDEKQ